MTETESAKAPADPPKLQGAYTSGITLTTATSGDIVISGGDGTGSGSGGNIVLSGGSSSNDTITFNATANTTTFIDTGAQPLWVETQQYAGTFTLNSEPDPTPTILTIDTAPGTDGIVAPVGSLAVCSQGSLWLKTRADNRGWSQVSTEPPTASHREHHTARTVDPGPVIPWGRDDLVDLVMKTVQAYEKDDTREGWEELGILETFPAVAPISTSLVADMMAVIEQEGEEVFVFISSSRDFADVRKFGDGAGVSWEGQKVSFFGIPFWHSHKIEPGYMAAVSSGRKLVLCSIMR